MATIREIKIYTHFTNDLVANLNNYYVSDLKGFGFARENESYYKSQPSFNDLEMTLYLGVNGNAYKEFDELYNRIGLTDSYIRKELKLEYTLPFDTPEEYIVFQNNKIYCDVMFKSMERGERKTNGTLEVKLVFEKKSAWYLEMRTNLIENTSGQYDGVSYAGKRYSFSPTTLTPPMHPDAMLARVKRLTVRFSMPAYSFKSYLKELKIKLQHVTYAGKLSLATGEAEFTTEEIGQVKQTLIEFQSNYVERNDNEWGLSEVTDVFFYDSRKKVFNGLMNTSFFQFTRSIYSYLKVGRTPFFEVILKGGNYAHAMTFDFLMPTSRTINWASIDITCTIVGELE